MNRCFLTLAGAVAILSLTLAAPVPKGPNFTTIPLQDKANQALDDPLGRGLEGNDLKNLPRGEQKFNDVPFEIGKKLMVQSASTVKRTSGLLARPPAAEPAPGEEPSEPPFFSAP